MIIEVTDLNLKRIGQIPNTWNNKQVDVLDGAGEFEFSMAVEYLEVDSLSFRPNLALSFLQHHAFIRVFEDGQYGITGQPLHIERREDSSGLLIANVKSY